MQAELRIRNMDLADVLQGYIDRRLRFALSRFGDRVGLVLVTLSDFNGTDGRVVKSCHISAELKPFGRVAARETDPDLYMAIDRSAGRVGRLFALRLGRDRDEVKRPAFSIVGTKGTRSRRICVVQAAAAIAARAHAQERCREPREQPTRTSKRSQNSRATMQSTRGGSDAS